MKNGLLRFRQVLVPDTVPFTDLVFYHEKLIEQQEKERNG